MTDFNKITPGLYFQKNVKKDPQKEAKQEETLFPKESKEQKGVKLDPETVLSFMGQAAQVKKAESKEKSSSLDFAEAFKPYITPKMKTFFTGELVARVTSSIKEFESIADEIQPIVKEEAALIGGKPLSDEASAVVTPLTLSLLDS